MIDSLVNNLNIDREKVIELLPLALQEIRNYTNQYFLTKTNSHVLEITEEGILFSEDVDENFVVGDSVELLNSYNNLNIYQIKEINGNFVSTEQLLVHEKNNPNIVMIKLAFRGVSIKTISDMLSYSVQFENQSGIKSQTLGGYSVTYGVAEGGHTYYPLELYGGLNSLRKLNDDYSEYRRKGYVRL